MQGHNRRAAAFTDDARGLRRTDRSPVAMGARCRTETGAKDYVALVDLSLEGCCVLSKEPFLKAGQRVTLQPESLSGLVAHVRWISGCLAGLRFENPLYGPVYEHLARTFAGEQRATPPSSGHGRNDADRLNSEMLRKMDDAQARDKTSDQADIDRYRRMILGGPRSGLRTQPARALKLVVG